MRKKIVIFQILYYVFVILVYMAFFHMASLILELSGESDLGAAMAVTYGVLFLMTPVVMAVLMRFSLLRWYVDPIAAAEIPLFLYLSMISAQQKRSGDLKAAFLLVNSKLSDDGGMGWVFLIGLFVFGLIMSISFARKRGQSISFQLLSKITKAGLEV